MKKNSYNLGLAYYRHYYDPDTWDFREKCAIGKPDNEKKEDSQKKYFAAASKPLLTQKLTKATPTYYAYNEIDRPGLDRSIILETTYPGMLLGGGYAHGIGEVQGEHKVGFYFDHTSGLPIIPGSSVKGVLRSVFPLCYKEESEDRKGRYEYIKYLLIDPEIGINKEKSEVDHKFIDALEREIFEGIIVDKSEYVLPMPCRDIFHDAILSGPINEPFLGDDFITPHNKPGETGVPAALRNPIPIQFLKVFPGIRFTFQFYLPDTHYYRDRMTNQLQERTEYLLTPGQKILLFKAIFLDMGIGAKTNVGYGQLIDPDNPPEIPEFPTMTDLNIEQSSEPNSPNIIEGTEDKLDHPPQPPKERKKTFNPDKYEIPATRIKRGKEVLARVVEVNETTNEVTVRLHVSDGEFILKVKYFLEPKPRVDTWCHVIINNTQGKAPKFKSISLVTNKLNIIENQ